MPETGRISRRDFLRLGSGAVALGVVPRSERSFSSTGLGLIGAGQQGLTLLRALIPLQNQMRVVGICDVSLPALTSAAALLQEKPRLTQDYRELLSWPEITAVMIVTPDFSHTPLALAALDAGKDVYLETPLTRTLEEFESIQNAAQNAGRILFTGETSLSHPVYAIAAEYIRAGLIGPVSRITITTHLTPSDTPQIDADSIAWENFLLYLAPRAFDAHLWARWQERDEGSDGVAIARLSQAAAIVHRVMGFSQPMRIAAQGGVYVSARGRETPDTLHALLEYAGCVVNFSAYPGDTANDVFSLHGTRGTLDLQHMRLTSESAIENPISEAMAQQATLQLTRASQGMNPLDQHLKRWLEALQRRVVPAGLLDHAAQQIRVGQRASDAYKG